MIACRLNGKYEVIARDTTKTKSSRRTLPLAAPIRKYLLDLQVRQAENRRLADYYIHDFYQVLDGSYETLAQEQE